MTSLRRPLPVAILIALAAELLFVIRLSVPHVPVFDEVHYLPAARALLDGVASPNTEHPLLGKALIAIGMALFGDNPFGWRVMSTFAATGVVAGSFAIMQLAFGRVRASVVGSLLVILNFTVYVQGRVAMLDGFMAAFVIAGLALFLWARRDGGWGRWIGAAVAFGLAVACKWTALPYALGAGGVFLWLKARDSGRRIAPQQANPPPPGGGSGLVFPGIGMATGAIGFGAIAALVYFASFAPAFFYASEPMTLSRVLPFQMEMYARQTQVLPPHTYQSRWWTWVIDWRPVWYLYEPADGAQRGILMLGNPLVMWGGLIALLACCWAWVKSGDIRLIAIVCLWVASVAIWAVIPKSLGFYYYYYLSSIFLCLAIAAAFDHWRERAPHWDESFLVASAVVFVYFFPILSAQALPGADAFKRWTWLASWI